MAEEENNTSTVFEIQVSEDSPSAEFIPANRAGRSRSTMVSVYESAFRSPKMGIVAASATSNDREPGNSVELLRMNTMRLAESRGDVTSAAERETSTQTQLDLESGRSNLPSNVPQHIKVNLTTQQLLQIKGEDIPPSDTNFSLALKHPGERLELVVNPVPDPRTVGSASVFHMLGKEGAKQPTILYGSLGYVLDYLIAAHSGSSKTLLTAYIPSGLRRPSMNVAARAESGKNIVLERIADWVVRLWDAFLLTYQDACTTEDLVNELVSRFEKTTERKPGESERPTSAMLSAVRFMQTSFETSNGHVVVARRTTDSEGLSDESLTSRTARAVLAWMGLVEENRSSVTIKTNTLLFTLHWLRSSTGALDLAENKRAYEQLRNCVTSATTMDDVDIVGIARLILKDLRAIDEICNFDRKVVENVFAIDFDGAVTRQTADPDQLRIREMSLCYAARPLPGWIVNDESIFRRNPEHVASVLTLMMYDLCYRHIHPAMLVTEKARQSAVPVQDMIRIFRVLSYWPLTCLFEEGLKITQRLHRLQFFVSIAEHLRKFGNFHALFAIMAGLTQPYAGWLWQALYQGDKTHKRFEDLKRAISSYGDYRVYKADLSHCHGKSRIPFLGVTNRVLAALEADNSHSINHPNLYYFARQVARSAAINEFIGGHRHPYIAKTGYTYAVCAGPPGASPYQLHPEGVVVGSRHAQHPPKTAYNGMYSQSKLSSGKVDYHVGVVPQVVQGPSHYGQVELYHNEELRLLLAWHLSGTMTEEAVKELCAEAKASQDEVVVHSLELAGFV